MVLVSEGFSGGRNFRLNRLEGINMPTKMLADNKNIVIAVRYAFNLLRCIPMRVFPLSFLKKSIFWVLLKRINTSRIVLPLLLLECSAEVDFPRPSSEWLMSLDIPHMLHASVT